MTRRVFVLVALLGVSISFACADVLEIGPVPEATDDGGGADDGATDSSTQKCDPFAPLGMLTPVNGLPSGPGILAVTLSPDELTAYVAELQGSDVFAPPTLVQYQRSSVPGPFGGQKTLATGISNLSTTMDNRTAFWSADEGADAAVLQNARIMMARRPNASSPFPFDAATTLAHVDGGFEVRPIIRSDGQELFFFEQGNGVAEYHTFADSGFLNAVIDPSLPGVLLAMSPDGLVAYMQVLGQGFEVAVSTRPTPDSAFSKPQVVALPDAGNVQWSYDPIYVSADYCTVYVFENMTVGQSDGGADIAGALFVSHKQP